MNKPLILITGATGLLGRPLLSLCQTQTGWQTVGAAFNRAKPGMERIDLSTLETIEPALDRIAPRIIIHTAAERRPDISEQDPAGARRLNVGATETIAAWCAKHGAFLIYISSDYVFDGTKPPYRPGDATNPLSAYGQSKLDGELAIHASGAPAAILRVPLLYGQVEWLGESPVTILVENMLAAAPDSPLPMEHWATRFPTNTLDVAHVLKQMVEHRLRSPGFHGTYHWSGSEAMTKYEMALVFAPFIGFATERLVADNRPPPGAPRPKDAHLDCSDLERLGIGRRTPFTAAVPAILADVLPAGCQQAR